MSARPLIGVTTSEVRVSGDVTPTPQGEPVRREMALGLTYLRAIEAAGGLPVVLPPLRLRAIKPLLAQLSGLCLSGGPDLDPEAYGDSSRHAELGPTEPDLDRFELALARHADVAALPILAICRGAQALNVARGGSLHQHLPDAVGVGIAHRQREPGDQAVHPVELQAGSLLARLTGKTELEVNSFHHQAVDRLGRGLRAVAWAPDGTIEAIEAPRRDFCLGVQWHAETIVGRREQTALFKGLVDAAREAAILAPARAA